MGWVVLADDIPVEDLQFGLDGLEKVAASEETIKEKANWEFENADLNDDGKLDKAELNAHLTNLSKIYDLNVEISDEFVDKHFDALDLN